MMDYEALHRLGFDDRDGARALMEKEHGLEGHPMAQRLFDLTWEYGHSGGWSEIYYYYADMADLLATQERDDA